MYFLLCDVKYAERLINIRLEEQQSSQSKAVV